MCERYVSSFLNRTEKKSKNSIREKNKGSNCREKWWLINNVDELLMNFKWIRLVK